MMKQLLSLILIPSLAFADCNWKAGIQPTLKHTFEYTENCHLAVGEMKQDLSITKQKLSLLHESLNRTDQALDIANERADSWGKAAHDMNEDMQKIERHQERNAWLCFGAGVLSILMVGLVVRSTTHSSF